MERRENSELIFSAGLGIIFLLLSFNLFTVTKLPIQNLAFTTMAWTQYIALFMLGFYIQKRKGFDSRTALFTIGMILFAFLYSVGYVLGEDTLGSSEAFTSVFLVLIFVLAMAQIQWETDYLNVFALISTGLIFMFLLQWVYQGFPLFQYQSSIRNPNIFGVFVAMLIYFPLSIFSPSNIGKRLLFGLGIITGLFLIYVSTSRAALLLIFIALIAKFVSIFSTKLFNMLFYVVMLFNFTFVFIYGWLYKSQLLNSFNTWFLSHFGKQIFSGRQDIWEPAIKHGVEAPLFGHFVGITPESYIPDTTYVHAHNQYLQIFLESGLVGLAGFIFLLYAIWRTFQKNLHSTLTVWSACFYLGILLYQSFEISLFGNMQAVGLFQWLIIAIGLGACITGNKQRDYLK